MDVQTTSSSALDTFRNELQKQADSLSLETKTDERKYTVDDITVTVKLVMQSGQQPKAYFSTLPCSATITHNGIEAQNALYNKIGDIFSNTFSGQAKLMWPR